MKRTILTLLTVFPMLLNAQNYTVQLESAVFIPVERPITTADWSSQELVNGNYYRYIQFYAIPTEQEKAALAARGVKLYNYIPNNTFMASIPASLSLSGLDVGIIRSVFPATPTLKLSAELGKNIYPEWPLREGDKIELTVLHHPDIAAETVAEAMRDAGALILHHLPALKAHRVVVMRSAISLLTSLPHIYYIEAVDDEPKPDNLVGRTDHRSNMIATDYNGGLKFDGTGVNVALNDDGVIGPHLDYQGRIINQYITFGAGTSDDHGDHCAGIIFGAGNRNPTTRGMASGASLGVYGVSSQFSSYYQAFDSIYNHYNSQDIRITSTSYSDGNNTGYTSRARLMDIHINDMPELMHVFSAGNSGTSNFSYGAGAGWGNITGGHKQAKNVITVGNLTYQDALANSSSRGPAKDGRIKPDICAVGSSVNSTVNPNTYGVKTGTSMSCPGVSGTLAQLYHAYRSLNNGDNPPSALIKATVLNTADELGNPGPDYKHGWGRINARRAYKLLEQNQYMVDSVSQAGVNTHSIAVPAGISELRVMVYWHDYEATAGATKALVNNLDMTITDPAAQVVFPWVLNRTPTVTALNANAVQGVDTLNNVEQVTIPFPVAGTYTVNVSGFSVPQGPQKYYVVYEFVPDELVLTYPSGGESLVPGVTETIRWDAYGTTGTFKLEYSIDNGNNWSTIANNIAGNLRDYNWAPSSAVTGKGLIRVTRGTISDQSDATFSVLGVPVGLTVTWVCFDSLKINYNAVTGASGYVVSILGNKYMDSVGFSTTTSCVVTNINTTSTGWVAVHAVVGDSIRGRRANAVSYLAMPYNCPVAGDNELAQIISPSPATVFDCQGAPQSEQVTIQVKNNGFTAVSNLTAKYTINNGPVVSESIASTISSQASINFTFTQPAIFNTPGVQILKAWIEHPGDLTNANDTITWQKSIIQPPLVAPPLFEDFETFTLCDTSANCGLDVCVLTNGWTNEINGVTDSADWRINSGPTPDAAWSGPSFDYNPGTAAGQYAYIEASGCFGQSAYLVSPCIDLSSLSTAQLSFAYHMFGYDIGSLHVDVLSNGQWQNNVTTPLTIDQGNSWQVATVSLSAFAGQVINIRFRGVTGPGFQSDMAIDDIKVTDALGVGSLAADAGLSIFPNPSEGLFNVVMRGASGAVDMVVTDLSGKVIHRQQVQPGSGALRTIVDLSNTASGVYFLSIHTGKEVINRKLTRL